MRFFIFHFQVENPQAVLFHLNKPYVSNNDFYYGRTKNFGFCVLILKQNKKRKKIPRILILLKFIFLKTFKLGMTKKLNSHGLLGFLYCVFLFNVLFFFQFQVLFYSIFIVKISARLQGVVTLAALYNLSIIIIRLTFSDMAANVSPKEHLKWIQCQSINMSLISRVLLALCNACIIGVNSNTFRNSTLTLILINLFKIHAWKKLNLCCGFRLNIFTLA